MRIWKLALCLTMMVIGPLAQATQTYTIKKGDTLSEITLRHFPDQQLYGPSGKLAEVIEINPQIENPDLIYPGNPVYLPFPARNISQKEMEEKSAPILDTETTEENKKGFMWSLSLLGGLRYSTYAQQGTYSSVPDANLASFNLKFINELEYDDFLLRISYQRYEQSYKSVGGEGETTLNTFDFGGFYKFFGLGLELEESPLFENDNSSVTIYSYSKTFLKLATNWEWSLPGVYNGRVGFLFEYAHLLSATINNMNRDIQSESGSFFRGRLNIEKKVGSILSYPLWISWENTLSYNKSSGSLSSGTQELGDVELERIGFLSLLGGSLKF